MNSLTKEQTIEKTKAFIEAHHLPITIKELQSIIYDAKSYSSVFQQWMTLCDTTWLELSQEMLDLITGCWNHFPHKDLWGKSPNEMARS